MPVWRTLVEPVAEGVGAAIVGGHARADWAASTARRAAAGGCPPGMDLGAMMGQMEPMLAQMSGCDVRRSRSGRPSGRWPARRVSGTEVGLPLVQAGAVALLPANIEAFGEGLGGRPDRGAALPRRPRGGPGAAVRRRPVARPAAARRRRRPTPATSASTPTGSSRRCSRSTRRDPAAMQSALSGLAVHARAQPGAAGRAEPARDLPGPGRGLGRRRGRPSHRARTCRTARRCGETVRRRRASGGPGRAGRSPAGRARAAAAPPARRREPLGGPGVQAGGVDGRDGAWAHPDVAPTAADLDDPLGYVERIRDAGSAGGDDVDAALERAPARGRVRRRTRVSGPTAAVRRAWHLLPPRPARHTGRAGAGVVPTAARAGHGTPDVLGRARRWPGGATPGASWRTWRAHPDAMWKQGPPAHLTASALVLDATGDHVLLTLHRKAGAVVPVRRPLRARRRRRACGGDPRGPRGVGHRRPASSRPGWSSWTGTRWSRSFGRCREHLDLRFAAVAPEGARHVVSEESLDVRWWPVRALPATAGADLPRLVAAARRHLALG